VDEGEAAVLLGCVADLHAAVFHDPLDLGERGKGAIRQRPVHQRFITQPAPISISLVNRRHNTPHRASIAH
jgi:hypothetical protein